MTIRELVTTFLALLVFKLMPAHRQELRSFFLTLLDRFVDQSIDTWITYGQHMTHDEARRLAVKLAHKNLSWGRRMAGVSRGDMTKFINNKFNKEDPDD